MTHWRMVVLVSVQRRHMPSSWQGLTGDSASRGQMQLVHPAAATMLQLGQALPEFASQSAVTNVQSIVRCISVVMFQGEGCLCEHVVVFACVACKWSTLSPQHRQVFWHAPHVIKYHTMSAQHLQVLEHALHVAKIQQHVADLHVLLQQMGWA